MQTKPHKSYHKNWDTVNKMMSEGWYSMLVEAGAEPEINQLKLARVSGVPYRTVKRHCRDGFVSSNIQIVVADFKTTVDGSASSPSVLAIQLLAALERQGLWFSVEEARHSSLLWERLAEELHDPLTASWLPQKDSFHKALYALFWLSLVEIERQFRVGGYAEESRPAFENRLKKLLECIEEGRLSVIADL